MNLPFVNDLFGMPITVSPIAVAGALIAAAGAFLIVSSLGMFGHVRLRVGAGVRLEDENNRMSGVTPYTGSFAERVLSPLIHTSAARTGEGERLWVERAYDLLDRKGRSSSDYYLRKVVCALLGFGAGIVLGGMAAASGTLVFLLILPLALSLLGYLLPRWELQHDLRRRAEYMFFEVPYVLDRLGVNLVARNGDLVEALNATLQRPEGGYLMRELLQVVEDNAKAGHLDRALARMAERNRDIPIVVRIAELLAHSLQGGTDLIPSLSGIGDRAMEEIENLIRRRGEENSQAMIAPSVIALAGVMVVMLGPAFMDINTLFH